MTDRVRVDWLDRVGTGAIALLVLGYIIFSSVFAEVCLSLPFLSFPIFVGEIWLACCMALLILKIIRGDWRPGREGWWLGAYIIFVLAKAFFGYGQWGAMALRDAALFYYPAFALFAYCFWSPGAWGRWGRRLAFAVVLIMVVFYRYHFFWPFSLISLGLILAHREEDGPVRFLFIVAILLLAPYDALFGGVRTVVVAAVVSTLFVLGALFAAFHIHRRLAFVWIALGLITVLVCVSKMTESGFWRRVDPGRILSGLRAPATVSHWDLPPVKLYNPDGKPPRKSPRPEGRAPTVTAKPSLVAPDKAVRPIEHASSVTVMPSVAVPGTSSSAQKSKQTVEPAASVSGHCESSRRPINVDMDNARFRLYIWRDMWIEYWREKPLFGFHFGYPIRSASMKEYGFATSQDEDGWMGAHNSFLHIMYRGGVVGFAVVVLVLVYWAGLVRDMVKRQSFEGIMLCAVLLNWMISANFFLIFELPYTAIPFWSLMGITAKYRSFLRKSLREK
ncbi:MAG: hypothetical protein HGA80_08550 [Candidatus Omnitrophica bacterium]|nr:hypothetical protein [Candidatus Omnitrophota bacterium]